ncbi:MAG: GNAT family N-acetyltransferase [Candidatus Paceibacterota bacterium]
MKLHIDIIAVAQAPVQYMVWNEEKTELAGYCLITAAVKTKKTAIQLLKSSVESYKEAAIWHIYVDQKYRRKKYATALIEAIKASYDTIHTQALTPEGKKLLMATGFTVEGVGEDSVKLFRWWSSGNSTMAEQKGRHV